MGFCRWVDKHWGYNKNSIKEKLPGLNNNIAFMHANSAGLTLNLLYLLYMRDKWLRRATDSVETTSYSVIANKDGLSKGKHHWIEHKRNNSDQLSSNNVTLMSIQYKIRFPEEFFF